MLTQEREKRTIVVLHGDQTGEELLHEALRVLNPAVLGTDLSFQHFDLSLDSRRATKNHVVEEAADAMVAAGFGLKAATISPEAIGDVGSPNTILRERIGGSVIVRTGRRIPGVPSVAGVPRSIAVVRMAVGDAYGAQEWRGSSPPDVWLAGRL
jgi:isocitrate dehydrogenase